MRIALLQMTSGIDPAANATVLETAIAGAKAGGAVMLFTPEMCGLLDSNRKRAASHLSDEAQDAVLARVRKAAADHGIWVALGSLAIKGNEKLANRSFVINGRGEIVTRYDKIHLFDVDLPTGESWRESAAYTPGQAASVTGTPVGRLGLSVCYDIRFPALYQALSTAGAELIAIPAAFTAPTGKAHWHVLMRARAIENAAWVIAAAQTGAHEDGRKTYGHSLVVNPWGEVVLDMGDAPGIGFADIDHALTADVRSRIPVIAHRREIGQVAVS